MDLQAPGFIVWVTVTLNAICNASGKTSDILIVALHCAGSTTKNIKLENKLENARHLNYRFLSGTNDRKIPSIFAKLLNSAISFENHSNVE